MAEIAEAIEPLQPPPDVSIADQKSASDVDAKLRKFAEEKREREAAKRAGSNAPPLVDQVASRLAAMKAEAAKIEADPKAHRLRLTVEQGDSGAIPDTFRRGMIPARFADVTFEGYQPKTRSQHAALDAARFWLERALAGDGCMLALIGPQGTGKSHLLYAAANALLDAGKRLYARPWYRLADELRYGGEHPVTGTELEADEVRRTLRSQKIVLLDEVRPTAATAFDDTELTKLSCHAYDCRYPMFVTTNLNPLSDVMGGPAASRFTQIVIDGPDWRQS